MKKNIAMALCLIILMASIVGCKAPLEASAFLYGDANGDGVVDNVDAVHILRYDAGLTDGVVDAVAADVNGDGELNSIDAATILRYDAGIIGFFSAEIRTVSFDLNYKDSGEGYLQTLKCGDIAQVPTKPERVGFTFTGWYTDAACRNLYDFQSPVNSSFTLYAGWESVVVYPDGAYVVKRSPSTDIAWDEVPKADIAIYKWVESVEYEAYAQLVYVEGFGFICKMTCMENDPLAQYTQYGDPVYLDSCMEFFAAWDNVSYINIESNSKAALVVQFGKTKKNRKDATEYLSMDEMFVVTPSVEEDRWTLTMEIPISKLQKFYPLVSEDTFVSGYTFKGNFYKIGSDPTDGTRHYGMWNEINTPTADFHQPAYFGTLVIE